MGELHPDIWPKQTHNYSYSLATDPMKNAFFINKQNNILCNISYISVYASHYANSSSSQYGLLNMILPFVTIGSKIVFCSLADRNRAHRTFFICFLVSALIGYGSFAVLPFFVRQPTKEDGLQRGTFAMICVMTSVATISMSVISCLSDAFAMNSTKRYKTNFGLVRLWGTIGWGVSALLLAFLNQYKGLPFLVPGLVMTIILLLVDIVAAIVWPNADDFKLDKSASDVSCEDVIMVLSREPAATRLDDAKDTDDTKKIIIANDATKLSPAKTTNSGPESNYGAASTTEQTSSPIIKQEFTGPTGAEMIDISSVKMQWILFKQVAGRRPSIFRYLTLFTISGALIALQWSYFFLYLEKIYQTDFTYISGLSMVFQSMLGELPFFILSQYFIHVLGRSHSLSISIASIGVRYLLYEYLLPNSSMYFVLLTEPFQGPNFALFHVVATEVALDYSDCEDAIVSIIGQGLVENNVEQIDKLRQALRATMQSLVSACYEGLGVGIGSIIGGLVIDQYGFDTLWFYSALIALFLGMTNALLDITGIHILNDKKPEVVLKSR